MNGINEQDVDVILIDVLELLSEESRQILMELLTTTVLQ